MYIHNGCRVYLERRIDEETYMSWRATVGEEGENKAFREDRVGRQPLRRHNQVTDISEFRVLLSPKYVSSQTVIRLSV